MHVPSDRVTLAWNIFESNASHLEVLCTSVYATIDMLAQEEILTTYVLLL